MPQQEATLGLICNKDPFVGLMLDLDRIPMRTMQLVHIQATCMDTLSRLGFHSSCIKGMGSHIPKPCLPTCLALGLEQEALGLYQEQVHSSSVCLLSRHYCTLPHCVLIAYSQTSSSTFDAVLGNGRGNLKFPITILFMALGILKMYCVLDSV